MLGKLFKHEMRATARIMWPIFAALLALSVLGNLSTRALNREMPGIINTLAVLVLVAFVFAVIAVSVMSLIVMIGRFKGNLLSDEGYLMFTLPVSVHSLVWSKILSSLIWFVASGAAMALAMIILSFRVEFVGEFLDSLRRAFVQFNIPAGSGGHIALIIAEFAAAVILAGIGTCLVFYAAMAVGYGFARHKALLSVVFFFVFMFATQIFGTLFGYLLGRGYMNIQLTSFVQSLRFAAGGLGWTLLAETIFAAAFYFVTTLCLRRRLNLE